MFCIDMKWKYGVTRKINWLFILKMALSEEIDGGYMRKVMSNFLSATFPVFGGDISLELFFVI